MKLWRALVARAKALWAREPVLLAAALPLLTVLGLVTAREASTITKVTTDSAALVTTLAAALKARAVVDSPATKAKRG